LEWFIWVPFEEVVQSKAQ